MIVPLLAISPADLVVKNAHVITFDGGHPTAFAVRGGRFVDIGSDPVIQKYVGPNTIVWDLKGKTVVPGFNDAHIHPGPLFSPDSIYATVALDPDHTPKLADVIAALKRKAEKTPKGTAVTGSGYQDTKLGGHPTCLDLDKASTEHPIIIRHSSGHLSVVNSYVLKASGITKETKDPSGGVIGRFPNGEPNGLLGESATSLIRGIRRAPRAPEEEVTKGYEAQFQAYLAKGITSIGVAGTGMDTLTKWEAMRTEGKLPVRLNVMISNGQWAEAAERLKAKGPSDDWIRMDSIKLYHGNSLSGHTCWVSKPYVGQPDYFGVAPARSQESLNDLVSKIHATGLQICAHSNGDREIDMVLKAYAEAQKRSPRPDARMRIEHCSIVTPDILSRIKAQKVVMVPHSYEWEHGDKMEVYGPERFEFLAANHSAIAMGIPLAGHSDAPVSAADPLLRIQCMVTRQSKEGKVYGASQRVTPLQAIQAWTSGSAFASFDEKSKGEIAKGLLADFVVLDADPLKTSALKIKDIKVLKTVVGGKLAFDAARGLSTRRIRPAFDDVHAD